MASVIFYKEENGSSVIQLTTNSLQSANLNLANERRASSLTKGLLYKNLASRTVDALAMLGHANGELWRLQRDQIRFAIHLNHL